MLREVIEALAIKPHGAYVDGTMGGGGHFSAIAHRLRSGATAIGIDRDPESIEWNRRHMDTYDATVRLACERFSRIDSVMRDAGRTRVDGILFDLGVSSRQIDESGRGFSYRGSAPLDMRMNGRAGQTAAELLAECDQAHLSRILAEYGEVRNAGRMARALVGWRESRPLRTAHDLRTCLEREYGPSLKYKVLAKVFQALRIAVNDELRELRIACEKAVDCLEPGGRLVVLSYHSLEDRIVKQFMRDAEQGCTCSPSLPRCVCEKEVSLKRITRKALKPTPEEVARNSRARSARLRVAQRVDIGTGAGK
jgi:16S rRNA (cytosine1402-N4)-methyltransferase